MNPIWRRRTVTASASVALALASASLALAADREQGGVFYARLTGYEEVPQAISSPGTGEFKAKIDPRTGIIDYEFSYQDMQDVFQAHIHFGRRGLNGGISVWLCGTGPGGTNPGPEGTPTCDSKAASFTGVIDETKVVGPAGQLLGPGEFKEFVKAMRAGATYANVHTRAFTGGEIRGQIRHRSEK